MHIKKGKHVLKILSSKHVKARTFASGCKVQISALQLTVYSLLTYYASIIIIQIQFHKGL